MPVARLSSNSEIVIPAELRNRLGIEPGDELMLEAQDDRIVIMRAASLSLRRLRELGGPRWEGAAEGLKQDREEWDR